MGRNPAKVSLVTFHRVKNIFTFVQQEVCFPLDGLRAVDRITSMLVLQALNYSINKWS